MRNTFIVLLGMGTVFLGLICIVFMCYGMSAIVKKFKKDEEKAEMASIVPAAPVSPAPVADRQAVIAATCAVIAEELGADVRNLKVVSFKRV